MQGAQFIAVSTLRGSRTILRGPGGPRLNRERLAVLLVALGAATGTACRENSPAQTTTRTYPYKTTCTVGMISDVVRQVAADKSSVRGIIGEGVDPHLYQATRSDILALTDADIIFYGGLLLEGRMSDSFVKVAQKRPVHAVTELLDESLLLTPPEFAGHHDPHVWMDPTLWRKCAELIAKTLGEFDPPNKDFYQKNYANLARRIDDLHAYARASIATIPKETRVLVTAHDAFNYFARAYDLEVHGIQGISTESEAGIADINRLVDLLVSRKVKAVFVESSVSDKNVKALIEGAASKGHEVKIGGTLFSDAMGKPDTYEGTYIGMIDHNVTTIVRALGGSVPLRGMQGKLTQAD